MVATTMTKISVNMASRTVSAISFGVFCRLAPSTRWIMRSRKLSPGSAVTRTSNRSETSIVPAVTDGEHVGSRLLQDRRGLPVMADLVHIGHTLDHLAVRRDESLVHADEVVLAQARSAGTCSFRPELRTRLAVSSFLVRRSEAALALPRHSASASAKFANQTVNSRMTVTTPL